MAVTRDELIAKVYEKCGYTRDVALGVRVNGTWLPLGEVGLDEFVSDIVPVLNERGWTVGLPMQNETHQEWRAMAKQGWWDGPIVSHEAPDPIEAAFAVALEVLGD